MADWRAQDEAAYRPVEPGNARAAGIVVGLVLLAACAACLYTAPTHGDFWWSDAPRHALNGMFIRDLVSAHPFSDPVGWAFDYYNRRPALTIMFYPPVFYVVEALAYAVFGVSNLVAQGCVTAFVLLLGIASYRVARFYLPRWPSLAAALLTMLTPGAALWDRQVMLDIPAYALLVTACYYLLRHMRDRQALPLYLASLFFLLAVYTKYNSALLAPAFLLAFLIQRGFAALRERHVLIVALLTVIGISPAILLTLKFGAGNINAVAGLAGTFPLSSADAWLFYIRALPDQLSWPVIVLGVAGVVVMAVRLGKGQREYALPVAWLVIGYLGPTLISVREPRHGLMALLPLTMGAPLAIQALLADRAGRTGPRQTMAAAVSLLVAVVVGGWTLVQQPVPRVSGYAEVASYLAQNVPKHGVVIYAGYRDGNLIFDISALHRPDLSVVRADKLLIAVPAGERRRGVHEQSMDDQQIADMLARIGPDYLVVQPGFWTDLKEMARLQTVLSSDAYKKVAHFAVSGDLSSSDGTQGLDILQPVTPPTAHHLPSALDLAIINRQIKPTAPR